MSAPPSPSPARNGGMQGDTPDPAVAVAKDTVPANEATCPTSIPIPVPHPPHHSQSPSAHSHSSNSPSSPHSPHSPHELRPLAPRARRLSGLGLCLASVPAVPSSLRPPSAPPTPLSALAAASLGSSPVTPLVPHTPQTPLSPHSHSHSPHSVDGIDIAKLNLQPVFTPPPGSQPLPALPQNAHPCPGPTSPAMLPIHSHHHQHHQGHQGQYQHVRRASTASSIHSTGSGHASPLLAPTQPTVAETGTRLAPDVSHASGQLERRSPRPRLVRLDSFGGEGLEVKPSSRRGSEWGDEVEELGTVAEPQPLQE